MVVEHLARGFGPEYEDRPTLVCRSAPRDAGVVEHTTATSRGHRPPTTTDAVQFGTSTSAWLRVPAGHAGTVILLAGKADGSDAASLASLASLVNDQGFATLSVPLVDRASASVGVDELLALARRLADIADWVRREPATAGRPCGCMARGVAAAVSLLAAMTRPRCLDALVLVRAATPLVEPQLQLVEAPVLLIEDNADASGLQRARDALGRLAGDADVTSIAGVAGDDLTEAGRYRVVEAAGQWFREQFSAALDSPRWRVDQEMVSRSRV
jgi:hypothetical protein